MVRSFVNYFSTRDWRLLVIEISSMALAVLSALLLESKFFQLFVHSDFWASAFAVLLVFTVTFSAHALADNLQRRPQESRKLGYKVLIGFLLVCYTGVLAALLGMSNYTMAVNKTTKDSNKLNVALADINSQPKVVQAKEDLNKVIARSEERIADLKVSVDKLERKENQTDLVYASQKNKFDVLINAEYDRQAKERDRFANIYREEESRLAEQFEQMQRAGKEEGTIGAFLARNPSALPMLALVILFVARLSFQPAMTRITERTEHLRLSASHTVEETERHIPTSEIEQPKTPEEAVLWYAQKKIGPGNGWNQRRIAREFFDGKLSKVNAQIQQRQAELAKFEEI